MPMRQVSRRPSTRYTRRSFFVDEEAIRRARRELGVRTNAETVRLAVERVVEMEEFWRFMTRSRVSLKPESIEVP
jgi:Arc/MetJ family transcription regulator